MNIKPEFKTNSLFLVVSFAFIFIMFSLLLDLNPGNAIPSKSHIHQITTNITNHDTKNYRTLTNIGNVHSVTSHYSGSLIAKVESPLSIQRKDTVAYELVPTTQGNIFGSYFPIFPKEKGIFPVESRVADNERNQDSAGMVFEPPAYKYNKKIAFVEPTFTYAAYQTNSFYNFYQKYGTVIDTSNTTITTDLDLLKDRPIPHGPFPYFEHPQYLDIPYIDYFKILQDHVEQDDPFVTNLTDADVHEGKIFLDDGSNAYDVLFLFHNEYATASEYSNLRQFVSNGGTIVFTDANDLFAEVSYNKTNDSITLVKGHYWKFVDGKGATPSISERWVNENKEWRGSNFFDVPSDYKVYFRNNPFNYTHSEEQYVTNPHAKILINYETTYSSENYPNATIATYYMDYGKGRVIHLGIWGHTLVENEAFLTYFDDTIIPLSLGSP